MEFKKGDKVKFIDENQLLTGEITGINIFSKDNFNYSVDVNVGSYIVSFTMAEDELVLAKPLVTIPQFVADNISKDKMDDITLHDSLYYIGDNCISYDRLYDWLLDSDNDEVYARAWLDGYEIEKEQLYYVEIISNYMNDTGGYLNRGKVSGSVYIGTNDGPESAQTKFTEQEIKEIDDRYWSFAIPVEEVEEGK